MEKIVLDNGIKSIAIENQDGELVTVLKINVSEAGTAERFAGLIQKLNRISEECGKEAQKLADEVKGVPDDGIDMGQVISANRIKISYLEKIIHEIDVVFGADTIRNVYREAYEMDPGFVPDEIALVEFIDKVIPVMNTLFGQRFETYKKKYNSGRRGKHSKSKDDLIAEYRDGKMNE